MKQLRLYTHTHTHTLDSIRKRKEKIGDNNQSKTAIAGITLVALVVTIVVLLILAGITITYVMGDNSVFNRASEAKLKTDIANWKEKLEMAKSSVIIDGLGAFNPDKYFDYIQEQGIIEDKETDVVDNEDGTYDVTTKPGYIFQVELVPTKEKPTDAEIEYIGQAGKIAPIIKRIETSSTQTSITAKAIVTRLGNGTVTYYYKSYSADESSYQEIADANSETGATQNTGIAAGEKYIIKVVAKNEIGEVSKTVEVTATKVLVESITLNKTKTTVVIGKTSTLVATVKPEDATNKAVKWTSSNEEVAIISETGEITGKTEGTAIVTAAATDGSEVKATCSLKVMDEDTATWEEINKIAKEIANDESITNDSSQATVIIDGETKTISVGGIYTVKYNGVARRVRVLGFKHDDLVDSTVYGGTHEKASISFEFLDFMTGSTYMNINGDARNYGGWAVTPMRKNLNGYTTSDVTQSGKIGGLGANLSNSSDIKQVKKTYIPTYNSASTSTCNDYLWLLSCSEIWSKAGSDYSGAAYGKAIGKEGNQYKWYQNNEKGINPCAENSNFVKVTSSSGGAYTWWLRSPPYNNIWGFCSVNIRGGSNSNSGSYSLGVAPGFCI